MKKIKNRKKFVNFIFSGVTLDNLNGRGGGDSSDISFSRVFNSLSNGRVIILREICLHCDSWVWDWVSS